MATTQSLKTRIFAANDTRVETVHVPEWGMDLRIRALTGMERDQFEESIVRAKQNKVSYAVSNFRARFLVLCIVDDEGNRVFDDGDATMLGMKNAAVINRLYEVGARLSGLSESDEAELTEGFANGQNGASTSA